MKIKTNFVTNSSSASFSILKDELTLLQKIFIANHQIIFHLAFKSHYKKINKGLYVPTLSDRWVVWEERNKVNGVTSMDNFDMLYFLKQIGVKKSQMKYKDHDYEAIWEREERKKQEIKFIKKYAISKISGCPCEQCPIEIVCTKDITKNTTCLQYDKFIRKLVKETLPHENKRRFRNKQ